MRCSHPRSRLKSGGYIVINQTEALVSIDVNSAGQREHNIETPPPNQSRAADEVARQLRLATSRLIVIDFITWRTARNDASSRSGCATRGAGTGPRQVGKISHSVMEMSRQRCAAGDRRINRQPARLRRQALCVPPNPRRSAVCRA